MHLVAKTNYSNINSCWYIYVFKHATRNSTNINNLLNFQQLDKTLHKFKPIKEHKVHTKKIYKKKPAKRQNYLLLMMAAKWWYHFTWQHMPACLFAYLPRAVMTQNEARRTRKKWNKLGRHVEKKINTLLNVHRKSIYTYIYLQPAKILFYFSIVLFLIKFYLRI